MAVHINHGIGFAARPTSSEAINGAPVAADRVLIAHGPQKDEAR